MVMVDIIGQNTLVLVPDLFNQVPPFQLEFFRRAHFAAKTEHLTLSLLGNDRVM